MAAVVLRCMDHDAGARPGVTCLAEDSLPGYFKDTDFLEPSMAPDASRPCMPGRYHSALTWAAAMIGAHLARSDAISWENSAGCI
jgi:hypothetical protein